MRKSRSCNFYLQLLTLSITLSLSLTYSPIFSSMPYFPLYSIIPPFHIDAYLWNQRIKRQQNLNMRFKWCACEIQSHTHAHTHTTNSSNLIVNPLVSLSMSPASMAPACSFHREKLIEALLSATRHFRTTLPSLVWLVEPAKKDSMRAKTSNVTWLYPR